MNTTARIGFLCFSVAEAASASGLLPENMYTNLVSPVHMHGQPVLPGVGLLCILEASVAERKPLMGHR